MSRFALILGIFSVCVNLLAGQAPVSTKPMVAARAAILMDRQTGLILWSYNADARMPMASTTKIMTAMVILDRGSDKLDQMVTVSERAWSAGGNWTLSAGDTLTLRDLLKLILINSSNAGTVASAEYLTQGNVEQFVGWMNEKAQTLGLKNTHFVNTHGLYDRARGAQHYTSAYDLAVMTRYALTNYPLIRETVRQGVAGSPLLVRSYPRPVRITNHNKILGQPVPGVPGAVVDGVKTGFVVQAGRCLVSSATLHGWQLIAVVLGGDAHYFEESQALLSYGFSRYQWQTYASNLQAGATVSVRWGTSDSVPLGTSALFGAPVPQPTSGLTANDAIEFRGKPLRAPITAGQELGQLVLMRDGEVLATAPAIALSAVPIAWWARVLFVAYYAGGIFLGLFIIGKVYGAIAKNHRRRRRRLATSHRRVDSGRPRGGQW